MNLKQKATILINLGLFMFFAVSIYILLKYAFAYMVPFLVSFAFVYISQGPAISLHRKTGIPKNVLTLLFLVMIILLVSFILLFFFFKIIGLFGDILSDGVKMEDLLNNLCYLIDDTAEGIPNGLKAHISFDSRSVISGVSDYFSKIVLGLFEDIIRILPGFVFSTVISVVFACFLAFDYDNIINFIKRQLNDNTIIFVTKLKKIVNYSLFNLFKGYLILMLITFLEIFIGLSIIGTENSIAISFIISFVDLLPVFGTGIVLIPWGVYLLIMGNVTRAISILILYVFVAIVRYFAEPKIIGKKVGTSPLISLLSMFIGLKFFGIIGLITFPLITSIIFILQNKGYIKLWK